MRLAAVGARERAHHAAAALGERDVAVAVGVEGVEERGLLARRVVADALERREELGEGLGGFVAKAYSKVS